MNAYVSYMVLPVHCLRCRSASPIPLSPMHQKHRLPVLPVLLGRVAPQTA